MTSPPAYPKGPSKMMRRVDSTVTAHVFFTTEGYDDFRKTLSPDESEVFTFAREMDSGEYRTKLNEWRVFRSLPDDSEMERIISELTGE